MQRKGKKLNIRCKTNVTKTQKIHFSLQNNTIIHKDISLYKKYLHKEDINCVSVF